MMKQTIRKQTLAKRNQLTIIEVVQHSTTICEKLIPYVKGTVGLYSAIGTEINVSNLQHLSNITCAYPKTYNDDTVRFFQVEDVARMKKGTYGILEPLEECEIKKLDVLIVPLVAFDKHCNRLGHGKGYYDRYLHDFKGMTIGVAHDCQNVDNVYEEGHDIPLDMILTESNIYKCPMK